MTPTITVTHPSIYMSAVNLSFNVVILMQFPEELERVILKRLRITYTGN